MLVGTCAFASLPGAKPKGQARQLPRHSARWASRSSANLPGSERYRLFTSVDAPRMKPCPDTNLRHDSACGGRSRAVLSEDGLAGDYAFELTGVGAIDYGDEGVVVHEAEGGIEREIGIKAGERLPWENRS